MSLDDIKQWVEFFWPYIRPLAALFCTFTLVTFFKSILKHYKRGIWDKFTIVTLTRIIAFITGYAMAYAFLNDLENAEQWALGMAVLNIPIYSGLLKYATSKQWLWAVALLKGRKLTVRHENGETVQKILDDEDKTEFVRRVNDK